jgi:hypothetical protein
MCLGHILRKEMGPVDDSLFSSEDCLSALKNPHSLKHYKIDFSSFFPPSSSLHCVYAKEDSAFKTLGSNHIHAIFSRNLVDILQIAGKSQTPDQAYTAVSFLLAKKTLNYFLGLCSKESAIKREGYDERGKIKFYVRIGMFFIPNIIL